MVRGVFFIILESYSLMAIDELTGNLFLIISLVRDNMNKDNIGVGFGFLLRG